jgi:hypothetical protein
MCGTDLRGSFRADFRMATVRALMHFAQTLRTRGMRFSGVVIS